MASSRTLILMRHAAAGHAGSRRDHDRPLTAAGAQDAAAAGDWIRTRLPQVDAVLCSTAVRTRQTLAATRIHADTTFADELYGGGIDDIFDQIALLPESAQTVLVVGHAPGVPSVAHELATVARLVRENSPAQQATGGDQDPVPAAELDGLRSFTACALAVLTTDAPWTQLADRGADLVTVRHADR